MLPDGDMTAQQKVATGGVLVAERIEVSRGVKFISHRQACVQQLRWKAVLLRHAKGHRLQPGQTSTIQLIKPQPQDGR